MQNKSTEKFPSGFLMVSCHYESAHLIRWWHTLAQWVLCLMFHYISKDFPCHLAVDMDNKISFFFFFWEYLNYLQIFLEPRRNKNMRWANIHIYFQIFFLNRYSFCLFQEKRRHHRTNAIQRLQRKSKGL